MNNRHLLGLSLALSMATASLPLTSLADSTAGDNGAALASAQQCQSSSNQSTLDNCLQQNLCGVNDSTGSFDVTRCAGQVTLNDFMANYSSIVANSSNNFGSSATGGNLGAGAPQANYTSKNNKIIPMVSKPNPAPTANFSNNFSPPFPGDNTKQQKSKKANSTNTSNPWF